MPTAWCICSIRQDVSTITLPPETEKLARQVAAVSGRTPEEVLKNGLVREAQIVGVALSLDRSRVERMPPDRADEIVRRISARPLLDQRSPSEILSEACGG